ncbi:ABC-three component system middle component 6 [Dyadobacter chenhuakuii]|uniref:Uncharacterized protein n=1 Tax=Dyadobacter chenhuakuii TaxID=2909339 RepID=A0A9X1QHY7_9BACT|nr:ABC-three component system middle component 6 [Dyadobacter chenhuakuii]MCF2500817.1 hypothetical protein [Dyadobacter chenhuakuii]
MFIPNQYENVTKSTIVLGADILKALKLRQYNVDDLFLELKRKKTININQLMNSITFLWLIEAVDYDNFTLSLKK